MPLSNQHKMAFLQSFEFVSTIVFVGTVSVGFAAIVGIVLYNMAVVLMYEAQQFPALAAIYLLLGLLGALFLAESMGMELKGMGEENVDQQERVLPVHQEDPAVLDEDPIAL
jgi:hypothetical protein